MSQHTNIAKSPLCPICDSRMAVFPDKSWRCPRCPSVAPPTGPGVDAPAVDMGAALEALEDAIIHTNNRGQGWEINGEKAVLVPFIELRSVMDRALRPAPGGGPALCPGRFTLPITASACGICGLGWPAHDRQNFPPPSPHTPKET